MSDYSAHGTGYCPAGGDPSARLAAIGEAPGRNELVAKHPFAGWSGDFVNRALGRKWWEVAFITNARKVLPPQGQSREQRVAGLLAFKESLEEDLAKCSNARTLLCIGADAFEVVCGVRAVSKYHGTTFTRGEVEALRRLARDNPVLTRAIPPKVHSVVVSLHPAYTTRGLPQFKPFIATVLRRALNWSRSDAGPIRLPSSAFTLDASPEEVEACFQENDVLSIDVETNYPVNDEIQIVGIAPSRDRALVFPWVDPYIILTQEYLESDRLKIGHNFLFDMRQFARYGIRTVRPVWDTQVAGAALWPPAKKAKEAGRKAKPGARWLSLALCCARVKADHWYWKEPYTAVTQALFAESYNDIPEERWPYLYCGLDNVNQFGLQMAQEAILDREGML